jgi:hypothetical protein
MADYSKFFAKEKFLAKAGAGGGKLQGADRPFKCRIVLSGHRAGLGKVPFCGL